MHYFIARIRPLPLAWLLVDPHLKVIPLETDTRLGGFGCTFSKRGSQPTPLARRLVAGSHLKRIPAEAARPGNFRFTRLRRRSQRASGPDPLANPQSHRNSHGDSSVVKQLGMHFSTERIATCATGERSRGSRSRGISRRSSSEARQLGMHLFIERVSACVAIGLYLIPNR